VLIKLEVVYAGYPKAYFKGKGMSDDDAVAHVNKVYTWYEIIDSLHRQIFIARLMLQIPEQWAGFLWPVFLIRPAPLDQLRAYARTRNSMQEEFHIVKSTLCDTMPALKYDSQTLIAEGNLDPDNLPKGFVTGVADYYCGGRGRSNNTHKQIAGSAIRLSGPVLDVIGEIGNDEHPDLARSFHRKLFSCTGSPVLADEELYCRSYRDMLSTNTLKGSSAFSAAIDVDRINAL